MRTKEEIDKARIAVSNILLSGGFTKDQVALLSGMSVALVWASGDNNETNTLARILKGEPVRRPEMN